MRRGSGGTPEGAPARPRSGQCSRGQCRGATGVPQPGTKEAQNGPEGPVPLGVSQHSPSGQQRPVRRRCGWALGPKLAAPGPGGVPWGRGEAGLRPCPLAEGGRGRCQAKPPGRRGACPGSWGRILPIPAAGGASSRHRWLFVRAEPSSPSSLGNKAPSVHSGLPLPPGAPPPETEQSPPTTQGSHQASLPNTDTHTHMHTRHRRGPGGVYKGSPG